MSAMEYDLVDGHSVLRAIAIEEGGLDSRMERHIDELDGFWVDEALDRTLHIGFEDEETLYFDLFDSDNAAYVAEGNDILTGILLNLRTGQVEINRG